jgi:hypothetical protein
MINHRLKIQVLDFHLDIGFNNKLLIAKMTAFIKQRRSFFYGTGIDFENLKIVSEIS